MSVKFAINPNGINKEWNMEILTTKFENREGSIHDVIAALKAGHAFIGGQLEPGARRSKAAMTGVNFITVEIDNATYLRDEDGKVVKGEDGKGIKVYEHQLTISEALEHPFIKKHCAIAYTSPSHTEEWHRFRLIFKLPRFVEGKTAEALTRQLMEQLPHDPACKDCSRVFYGNTNAEFFIVNESAVIEQAWIVKAITEKQRELADRERARKAREQWLRDHADEVEETKALVLDALNYIPTRVVGGNTYGDSLRVLMVLKDLFGESEAEMIAEAWSPSVPGTTWNIPKKLRSFKRPNGVGIGSLFKIAQQNGFRFPERKAKGFDKSLPAKLDAEARRAEFSDPGTPKTLKEAFESVESQENGYAALRLAISDVLVLNDPLEREYKLGKLCTSMAVSRGLVRQIVNDITRRKDARKTSFTLEDYMKMEIQGVQWLIPNYLPQTGLTMMGGFAKDGKTTFLWKMCESLLTGGQFLGETPTKQCRVLFVECEETSDGQIIERLESVGLLERFDLAHNLRIEKNWVIDDLATLENWIIEHQADVVFIDSLRKVSSKRGVSENSQEYADAVYDLQTLINNLGKACIILHHTNKNKEAEGLMKFAGSSALLGATDNLIGFSRVKGANDQDRRRAIELYGRNCKGSYEIEWEEGEYPQFNYKLIREIGVSALETTIQQRILNAMQLNQKNKPEGMSASFLKTCLEMTPEDKSIYRPLKQLIDKQIISYRKDGKVRLYYLPGEQDPPPPPKNADQCNSEAASQLYQQFPELHAQLHTPESNVVTTQVATQNGHQNNGYSSNGFGHAQQKNRVTSTPDNGHVTNRVTLETPQKSTGSAIDPSRGGRGGTQCASPETLTEILGDRGLVKVGMWYEYCLDHLSKAEQAEWTKNRGIAKLVGRVGKVNRLGYNEHGNVVAFLTDPYNEPFSALPGCLQATLKPEIKPDAAPRHTARNTVITATAPKMSTVVTAEDDYPEEDF